METLRALMPFALILVAFYLLIVRPGRARQRAAREVQEQALPGAEVMTTSGIYGRVVSTTDDQVELEVSPGTTIRFAKAAVGRVVSGDAERADDEPAPAEPAVAETDGTPEPRDHTAR